MKFNHLQRGRIKSRLALFLVSLTLLGAAPAASGESEPRPDPPTNVDAIAVSVQEVILTWSAPSADAGITRYSIYRIGVRLATSLSQTPAFVDIDVHPSAIYTYTVRAIGPDDDSSAASNIAFAQTPALPETPDISPPTSPGSLTATALPNGVLLDWYDAIDDSDITVYIVRRDGLPIAIVRSGTLSYIDMTAQPPATAIYTVEAVDVMGQHSAPSNAAAPALKLP